LKTKARNPGAPARPRAASASQGGFTLVEVMIALAIIGITAVVLLEQRLEVVRDAGRARDLRTLWILASQKLAELELDKTLWTGQGFQSNGDFAEADSDYREYYWDYQIVRVQVDISDPKDPKSDKKPRDLLRLTLGVRAPGMEEPFVLEAEFPIQDPNAPPPAKTPADGKTPEGSGTPPAQGPGGGKK
jgi:prepilin-type N-terminal cleavage/methylation domain-containing protein